MTNEHKSEHCPNSARRARLDLVAGRVVPKFHYTDPTRPDPRTAWVSDKSADFSWLGPVRIGPIQTRPCLRPGLRQSLVRVKFHYTDTDRTGPDPTTQSPQTCQRPADPTDRLLSETLVGDPG